MVWVKTAWCFLTSFLKRSWDLTDYPIRMRQLEPREPHGRYGEPFTWNAQIANWWLMQGHGYSRSEALADLAKNFASFKSSPRPLPRPGWLAPVVVEFASCERILRHKALAADFVQRIVGPFEAYFMSDESVLWDFHEQESNDHLHKKILEVYGVDVSDIESGSIPDILDRIAASPRHELAE